MEPWPAGPPLKQKRKLTDHFTNATAAKVDVGIILDLQTPLGKIDSSSDRLCSFCRSSWCSASQAKAVAAIINHFDWRDVVLVYEDTIYGIGLLPFLTERLLESNALVSNMTAIFDNDLILEKLFELRKMQTRVFVVHMLPPVVSRFFKMARRAGMMGEGYAWIIADALTSLLDSVDSETIEAMQGVVGVKEERNPWSAYAQMHLRDSIKRPLVEKLHLKKGLSGDFMIKNGELQPSVFEIMNKVDAVVADITMSATRAQQVDFTIPYIESRISTVVPIKEKESAWDFMEPLTSKLWLAIGATFVFTGFVVWLLEYRLNEAASQADRDDFLVRLLNTNFITEGESEEQIRGDCVAICRARAIDELHCELDIFAQSDFRNITMKALPQRLLPQIAILVLDLASKRVRRKSNLGDEREWNNGSDFEKMVWRSRLEKANCHQLRGAVLDYRPIFIISSTFFFSAPAAKVDVGVILDLQTIHGKMYKTCISMAIQEFYSKNTNYSTVIVPHFKDSSEDVVSAASAAIDLLKNTQVVAILGLQTSIQADFVIEIGDKVKVPIVSPATRPSLSSHESPYFITSSWCSASQAKAVAAVVKNFVSPAKNDEILQQLNELKKKQAMVFVVHMPPSLASRFFQMAKESGMMSKGYAWIVADPLISLLDSEGIEAMQGVVDLNVFGLWAYESIAAVAEFVERGADAFPRFKKMAGGGGLTDLEALGTSNSVHTVGFWTEQNGISKDLAIIWPGKTTNVPYGSSGRNGVVKATGFCIDVFEEVLKSLPYGDGLAIEYISFENVNYDDLVQVFLQNIDAAVGDVTITSYRSRFVDFTVPYTEPGLAMLVPTTDQEMKNGWIFMNWN
ncbi:hypothetical protein SASPL_109969 [Salvia splendens]|uniref:Uncharacterized protein n=1 Tax=Salvia splendens TaxID=180675 RepID=A0A8X8Y939_SALSN|nr:hypothetical protein SASPL_109969 [Salvia splendens]